MNEQETLAKIFGEEYTPTEKEIQMDGKVIRIEYCGLCDSFFVRCPRCGNNCCNAGSGKEENGEQCILCMKAYEFQDILNNHGDLIEELLLKGNKGGERKKVKKL